MGCGLKCYVIAEWRGVAENAIETKRLYAIGEILEKLLPAFGFNERLEEGEVLEVWREIVGPFFASYSTPTHLKDGILYIQVHQPSIRYELDRTWKLQLLEKLQERFGKRTICGLRF